VEQTGAHFFVQARLLVNDCKVQNDKDPRTSSDFHIQRSSSLIFTGNHFPHRLPYFLAVHFVSDSADLHDQVYAGKKIRKLLVLVWDRVRTDADSNDVLESG
jgi:hypothetical protein